MKKNINIKKQKEIEQPKITSFFSKEQEEVDDDLMDLD